MMSYLSPVQRILILMKFSMQIYFCHNARLLYFIILFDKSKIEISIPLKSAV